MIVHCIIRNTCTLSAQIADFLVVKSGGAYNCYRRLKHGAPTRGPVCCIMQPAATFVNYVYTIRITQ